MKRLFRASIRREGQTYVAQCLEVDVASQGASEDDALDNLKEAVELHFAQPGATLSPDIRQFEVEV